MKSKSEPIFVFRPIIYSLEKGNLNELKSVLQANRRVEIIDTIEGQLLEYLKCLFPARQFGPKETQTQINAVLKGISIEQFGTWVYYPWKKTVVRLLPEKEFIAVRTNRNLYKITPSEYQTLKSKKIGIVGLSVGSSIAITMAQERIFDTLRLADFDELELSNCNRINTSLCNLGLPKVVITARAIAEIDPYLNVEIFEKGINNANIDSFFNAGGKLDLILDECDEIAVKIKIRQKAKSLKVPVIMDTSDRGLIDIERFDVEPNRPIFHGLLGEKDISKVDEIKNPVEKLSYIVPILGLENLSVRGKTSMLEIGETLSTWPQLASSVTLGAGATVNSCRRLLCGENVLSGRYYVDVDSIIPTNRNLSKSNELEKITPITDEESIKIVDKYFQLRNKKTSVKPPKENIKMIVEAAILAPTSGNDQPWKWVHKEGCIFLFHDKHYSISYGDFKDRPSMLGLGSALENVRQIALHLKLNPVFEILPLTSHNQLIAAIYFSELKSTSPIFENNISELVKKRCTNRGNDGYNTLKKEQIDTINNVGSSDEQCNFYLVEDQKKISEIGEVIGACDKIRLLNPSSYKDFIKKEIRWTPEDLERTKTGNDFRSLQLNELDSIALRLIKDERVMEHIKNNELGNGFTKISHRSAASASAIGIITVPSFSKVDFLYAGMLSERIWLKATDLNLAFQPLISPVYFFMRLVEGQGAGLNKEEQSQLHVLRDKLYNTLPQLNKDDSLAYLFRINIAKEIKYRSTRRAFQDVFTDCSS